MRSRALLLVASCLLLAADAKDDAKTKQEVEKFAGTWTVVTRNDKKPTDRKWVLTGDKITDHRGDKSQDGKFKIDPAKKHIDLVGKDVTFVGIYEFSDGDKKLKVCGAQVPAGKDKEEVRPKELTLKKGWILFQLERAK